MVMLAQNKLENGGTWPDHPEIEFPNEPKGIKAVLSERGIFCVGLCGKCPSKCDNDQEDCCNNILQCQLEFHAQKSIVQEVIEANRHLYIFCPSFMNHCELTALLKN